ncbi:MAG: ATP-binding cassette domain-containing protein [Fimbriimonadaceae bacterium]|nr:ATP-binding cassette domain-containing protein [Chitinophagales bacterium]
MDIVLSTEVLTKHYGVIKAVNSLKLNIPKQTVFGLLGPNGSGKTTTLGMVLGIIHPTTGSFSWFNNGSNDINRKRIGSILEHPIFYPYLSGEQNLKIAAKIKDVNEKDIERVLNIVELYDRRKSAAKTYSLGMKQRLSLGAALLGDPEVLVLDEPTNGLDPQGIAEVRGLINKVAQTGKTIILASHLLDEVEKVCSHVAVIKNGNLLAEGSVAEIIKGDKQIEIGGSDLQKIISLLSTFNGVKNIVQDKEILLITVHDDILPSVINKYLLENSISVEHITVRKKRLEEQFLEITA